MREHLIHGGVFAILIEPMQCEGGDRYSSSRFHLGLINLATAFDVPLIYDEIQTGFGLGGEFFWHRLFDLQLADGHRYAPAGVVCRKKAQLGISLTRGTEPSPEHSMAVPSVASLIRGYIQASVIDQFQSQIETIEQLNRSYAETVLPQFSPAVLRPRHLRVFHSHSISKIWISSSSSSASDSNMACCSTRPASGWLGFG